MHTCCKHKDMRCDVNAIFSIDEAFFFALPPYRNICLKNLSFLGLLCDMELFLAIFGPEQGADDALSCSFASPRDSSVRITCSYCIFLWHKYTEFGFALEENPSSYELTRTLAEKTSMHSN